MNQLSSGSIKVNFLWSNIKIFKLFSIINFGLKLKNMLEGLYTKRYFIQIVKISNIGKNPEIRFKMTVSDGIMEHPCNYQP